MKSVCFFSSYFKGNKIPYYCKVYLEELTRHFSEVVFLTDTKELSNKDLVFLQHKNIQARFYKNEGYDFGMWYKAWMEFPVQEYDRIALVNDSCILFKKLDVVFTHINNHDYDYCGILDSYEIAYHLHSFFIIINKRAIEPVKNYFLRNGVFKDFNEVVKNYEIGLSQYMINNNFKVGSVFTCTIGNTPLNSSFLGIEQLLSGGFPMIKKKIIFAKYRRDELKNLCRNKFNFSPLRYFNLIRKNEDLIIDIAKLKSGLPYFLLICKVILYSSLWKIYFFGQKIFSFIYLKFFK